MVDFHRISNGIRVREIEVEALIRTLQRHRRQHFKVEVKGEFKELVIVLAKLLFLNRDQM